MQIREDINVFEIDHLTQELVSHEFYTQVIMRIREKIN